MKTQFNSRQHNVSKENLEYIFPLGISNVDTATLLSINVHPKGHGYFDVIVDVEINGMDEEFRGDTSNMQVLDCWKEGEESLNEAIFESWADVVDSLLYAVDFEEKVEQLAMSSDEIRPNALEILEENYSNYIGEGGLKNFSDWVLNKEDNDPNFEQWLFYKAENIGDFGSGKTKLQEEALEEFFECL